MTDKRPEGINIIGIGMDGEGMQPDLLDETLSSWNESRGRRPRVVYIVPYCLLKKPLIVELDRIQLEQVCPSSDARHFMQFSKNMTSSSSRTIHTVDYLTFNTYTRFSSDGALHDRG